MTADGWRDYEVLATGCGEKLERWGNIKLLRPDPQVIWGPSIDPRQADAHYHRDNSGGGGWEFFKRLPDQWEVGWRNLRFIVRPMGFKHVGLFPEQAVNWRRIEDILSGEGRREVTVLNLFAYTGGATVAAAKAGAKVTHVDAARGMVERAGQNARLSEVAPDRVRYIVDDCYKFVLRELKRGKRYNAVIMDPPSYGRGPAGETWKIEDDLCQLVETTVKLLDDPVFYLINSYTTGLQPSVLENILRIGLAGLGGTFDAYEVCLPADRGLVLPCGCSGMWRRTQRSK